MFREPTRPAISEIVAPAAQPIKHPLAEEPKVEPLQGETQPSHRPEVSGFDESAPVVDSQTRLPLDIHTRGNWKLPGGLQLTVGEGRLVIERSSGLSVGTEGLSTARALTVALTPAPGVTIYASVIAATESQEQDVPKAEEVPTSGDAPTASEVGASLAEATTEAAAEGASNA